MFIFKVTEPSSIPYNGPTNGPWVDVGDRSPMSVRGMAVLSPLKEADDAGAPGASNAQRGGESGATVLQPIIRRTPSERSAQTDGKSAKMGAKSRSHMPDICVARACVS